MEFRSEAEYPKSTGEQIFHLRAPPGNQDGIFPDAGGRRSHSSGLPQPHNVFVAVCFFEALLSSNLFYVLGGDCLIFLSLDEMMI